MAERSEHSRSSIRSGVYLVGDLRVDLWRGEVRRGDRVSSLGGQPLAILGALIESPDRRLGREELQACLWPDEAFGDLDQRLNAAVRLLRRALGDSPDEPRYLETLRGRGYGICATVEPVESAGSPEAAEPSEAPETSERRDHGEGATSPRRRPSGSRKTAGRFAVRVSLVILSGAVVALVAALSGDSGPPERSNVVPGTSVGAAYRHYLAAARSARDQNLDTAKQQVETALDLDPGYSAAHVLLGRLHRATGEPERAENAFLRAVALEPSFSDAHLSLANVRFWSQWKWAEAERNFQRARDLSPGRAEVHHSYAWYLLASRRFEEAAASMETALTLDPMSAVLHSDFGWFQYRMRNYPAALRTCHVALDLEPMLRSALDCRHRALARLGSYDEALREVLELAQVPEEVEQRVVRLPVGDGYRELLLYLDRRGSEPSRFVRAMNLAAADRADLALRQLELAARERDSLLVLIDVTPEFDSLVPDERFQAVRRIVRAGAQAASDGPRRASS